MKEIEIKIYIIVYFFFSFQQPSVGFADPTISTPIKEDIYEWIFSKEQNRIYLFLSDKKVVILDGATLTVKNEIDLDGEYIDVEDTPNFIYIALSNKSIAVINKKTEKLERTINNLNGIPMDITSSKDSLFYTVSKPLSPGILYKMSLASGNTTIFETGLPFTGIAIDIDPVKDVLYIGHESFGFNLYAYDLSTGKEIDVVSVNEETPSELGFLRYENNHVYYGGYRFNSDNLQRVDGRYGSNNTEETIYNVYDQYVVTSKAVYDKNTFQEVMPTNGFLEGNHGFGYIFTPNWELEKISISDYVTNGADVFTDDQFIAFQHPLSDWILEKETNMIYAISEQANRLYVIEPNEMALKKVIDVGSNPTSLSISDGKIYIARNGTTSVLVLDLHTWQKVKEIELKEFPYKIEVVHNHLFYINNQFSMDFKVVDINTNDIYTISDFFGIDSMDFNEPELNSNEKKGIFYVGESGHSNTKIYAFSVVDKKLIAQEIMPYAPKAIIMNDDELFYGGEIFHADSLTKKEWITLGSTMPTILENYYETWIGFTDSYLISNEAIYDRKTQKRISETSFKGAKVELGDDGSVYVYGNTPQIIKKYETMQDYIDDWPLYPSDVTIPVPDNFYDYFPEDIQGHWAEQQLEDFVSADIIKGYRSNIDSEGLPFVKPEQTITRAEFVALLVRSLGITEKKNSKKFSDVQPDQWFYSAINTASSNGIVSGVTATSFYPNHPIQRDEMAAIISRAFEKTINWSGVPKTFQDVPTYWATPFINKVSGIGIVTGKTFDSFFPKAYATRAEATVMLYRAFHKETSSLPTDEQLMELLLSFEGKRGNGVIKVQSDVVNWAEKLQPYVTGYSQKELAYDLNGYQTLLDHKVEFTSTHKGGIQAMVLDKSNRFAAVELKNAQYDNVFTKEMRTKNNVADNSGIYYLKKMPETGEWKIYNAIRY